MDLNRTPATIATDAAESIRALNHRTLAPKSYVQPGDVSDTAGAIATLLERLPQAIDQMEAAMLDFQDTNAIRLDTKPADETSQQDVFNEVFAVTAALTEVRRLIRSAHSEMKQATGPLSHMGGLLEDDEDS